MNRLSLFCALALAASLLGISLACGGGGSRSTAVSYTIAAAAGANGAVSPAGTTTVAAGADQTYAITPDPPYLVDKVLIDGTTDAGPVTSYTFAKVQANHTLSASFVAAPVTYAITVTQTANGTIAPASTRVASGADLTFSFTPAAGYALATILVDGAAQASVASTYGFRQVRADHSLSATFLPSSTSSMLAAYGVTPVTTAPVDPATGSAVDPRFNPLGGVVTKLDRRQGIYLTGLNVPTSQNGTGVAALWPDLMGSGSVAWGSYLTAVPGGLTPAWLASPHATAAGDLDGSGKDSIVTVYYNYNGSPGNPPINRGSTPGTGTLNLLITSPSGLSGTVIGPQTITSQQEFFVDASAADAQLNDYTDVNGQVQVALGDLDGDGQLEIAVAVDSTFMILKKNATTGSYGVLAGFPVNYRSTGGAISYSGWWTCRVAAGDINGDGQDEFVVVASTMGQTSTVLPYHVYGCLAGTSSCAELASGPVVDKAGNPIYSGNVAIGDLKGDGGREVIFSGASSLAGGAFARGNVIMGTWQGFGDGTGTLTMPGGSCTASVALNSAVRFINPTFCLRQGAAYAGAAGLAPQALLALNQIWVWRGSPSPSLVAINQMDAMYQQGEGYQIMAAGNVLGASDGSDQIVAAYYASSQVNSIYVYQINYGSGTLPYMLCPASAQLSTWGGMPSGRESQEMFKSLCLPDWSGLSTEVTFTGRSANVVYSPPRIAAVLASPPYYGGLGDPAYLSSLAGCSTSWGTSRGTSITQTHSFEFSAKQTVGFKYSFELAQTELELKASVQASLSLSASQMSSQSVSQTYSQFAGADYVLYTVVPYDVYTYEQAGVPDHGMTINVPRQPQMMMLEVGAYNGLANQPNPVDTTLLAHTLGVPASYPTYAAMRTLLANAGQGPGILWDPSGVQVFAGASGYSTSSVTQSAANAQTHGSGLTLSLEWQETAGGVLFGREYDFTGQVEATLETDTGTFISGSSPYLPAGVPATYAPFYFGIAAYPVGLGNQSTPFTLVNYWYSPQAPSN